MKRRRRKLERALLARGKWTYIVVVAMVYSLAVTTLFILVALLVDHPGPISIRSAGILFVVFSIVWLFPASDRWDTQRFKK